MQSNCAFFKPLQGDQDERQAVPFASKGLFRSCREQPGRKTRPTSVMRTSVEAVKGKCLFFTLPSSPGYPQNGMETTNAAKKTPPAA
jgi:hypothetical protein